MQSEGGSKPPGLFSNCVLLQSPFPNLPSVLIFAATFISLPSSSQNRTRCGVRGRSVKNKTRKHWVRGEVSDFPQVIRIFRSPLPPSPHRPPKLAATERGGLESGLGAVGPAASPASDFRITGLPFSGMPGHAHPHTHLPGSGGIFSSAFSSPELNARLCVAQELVPRGGRRTAVKALSTFVHVSSWSREGRIASKLRSSISTPTKGTSPVLYPHSLFTLLHQVLSLIFVFVVLEAKSSSISMSQNLLFSGYGEGGYIFLGY